MTSIAKRRMIARAVAFPIGILIGWCLGSMFEWWCSSVLVIANRHWLHVTALLIWFWTALTYVAGVENRLRKEDWR